MASNRPTKRGGVYHRLLAVEASSFSGLQGLLTAGLAEFFCTAAFVYWGTAAVTSGCHTGDVARQSGSASTDLDAVKAGSCFLASTNLLNIALAFGFAIFVLVYASANFSGGHLNPAVTMSFLVTGKMSLLRASTYIVCQMSGACLGSVLVKAIDPQGYKAAMGAANRINTWATTGNAVGAEIVLTAIFVFVVHAAVDTRRALTTAHLPVLAPLAIGIAVFMAHIIAVPIDGCSINPARSFGVAAVAHTWVDHWVFWVGPLVGACGAGILYTIFSPITEVHSGPKEDPNRQAPAGSDAYTV